MPRDLPPPVSVTEAAKARILELVSGKPGVAGLRVSLKSSGCSGLKYDYELAKEILPTDRVVDLNSTKLLIDGKAELYLIGAEMDYRQDKFGASFDFRNPNEGSRCGCGESFSPRDK